MTLETLEFQLRALRDYFNEKFIAHGRQHEMERLFHEAASKIYDEKLVHLNELRTQVIEDRQWSVSRSTYEAERDSGLTMVESRFSSIDSRMRSLERLVYIGAGIAIVVSFLVKFVVHL